MLVSSVWDWDPMCDQPHYVHQLFLGTVLLEWECHHYVIDPTFANPNRLIFSWFCD